MASLTFWWSCIKSWQQSSYNSNVTSKLKTWCNSTGSWLKSKATLWTGQTVLLKRTVWLCFAKCLNKYILTGFMERSCSERLSGKATWHGNTCCQKIVDVSWCSFYLYTLPWKWRPSQGRPLLMPQVCTYYYSHNHDNTLYFHQNLSPVARIFDCTNKVNFFFNALIRAQT